MTPEKSVFELEAEKQKSSEGLYIVAGAIFLGILIGLPLGAILQAYT